MTKTWPVSATDDDLRQAVAEWSELLAQRQFAAALSMFDAEDGPYAEPWTPELLETTVANYGCSDPDPEGRVFAITSLYALPSVNAAEYIARNIVVDRDNLYGLNPSRYLGMIHYDGVPLNGAKRPYGAIQYQEGRGRRDRLGVVDIHVM